MSKHEHDEDCGHNQEQHDRLKKKFDSFMEEIADDMFTEKDLANLYTIISGRLKALKVPTTLSHIRAFSEGFDFGIYAAQNQERGFSLTAGIKRIAKLKSEEIRAVAAKSLELQDEDDDEA